MLLLITMAMAPQAHAQGGGSYVVFNPATWQVLSFATFQASPPAVDCGQTTLLTVIAPTQETINEASATSTSSRVRPEIMGGKLSADPSVVFLSGRSGNPFSDPWVGTGTFVACRCVVTAQHVLDEISSGAVISQTNGSGSNIFDDLESNVNVKQTFEKRRTSPTLGSIAFNASPGDIYDDIAFVWTTAPNTNNNPAVQIDHRAGYMPKAFDFTLIKTSDDLKIIGYGATWPARTGTQRTGDFSVFGAAGYPTTRTIPGIMTTGLETGALYEGKSGTWWTEYGDSGAPVLRGDSIVAIHRGRHRGVVAEGTTVAPFQPWIRRQLAKFCKPRGNVGVAGSDNGPTAVSKILLTITGGAFYWNGKPGELDEEEFGAGQCLGSLTCGATIRGDDPFFEGITISATVTPRLAGVDVVWSRHCDECGDPNVPCIGPTCTFPVPSGSEDGQAEREFTLKGSTVHTGGP